MREGILRGFFGGFAVFGVEAEPELRGHLDRFEVERLLSVAWKAEKNTTEGTEEHRGLKFHALCFSVNSVVKPASA
jgi:hypothetical protein